MDAKKRLEILRKQLEELKVKQAKDAKDIIASSVHRSTAPVETKPAPVSSGKERKNKESAEISLFSQKQEAKKVSLSVGINCIPEDLKPRVDPGEELITDSSEDEQKEAGKLDLAELRDQAVVSKPKAGDEFPEFKVFAQDEFDDLVRSNPSFKDKLISFEKQLEKELLAPARKMDLIEDYIFNTNRDLQEQKGGYVVRKYEDLEFENKYLANDVIFLPDKVQESESVAVVYSRNSGAKDLNYDYAIGIFSGEKRVAAKYCRSEIKKITPDADNEKLIYGGLDNGKIALWDLRTDRVFPEQMSKISDKCNYLPVIDLIKTGNFIFSLGLEARLCKWDSRKLDEPVIFHDIYGENDNITKLEASTLGLLVDPSEADTIYVNTAEGSVYEFLLTTSSFQQRNVFPNLHEAPIIRIQSLDIKNFFREAAASKKYQEAPTPSVKFINYWVSASFDWNIKIYKGTFGSEEGVIKFHRDFVTSLESNKQLNPFVFASADAEGKLAVWKIDRSMWDSPLFEWSNSAAIHKICWNLNGTKLAVVDNKGSLNVLGFPKAKIALNERSTAWYLKNGVKLSFKN